MSVTIRVDRVDKVSFYANGAEIAQPPVSHLVVEAVYKSVPSGPGTLWDLDALAARRLAFPLTQDPDPLPLDVVDSDGELMKRVDEKAPVVLWIFRANDLNALVSVGEDEPLSDLALDPSSHQVQLGPDPLALAELGAGLGGPDVTEIERLTVCLESAEGDCYPLPIAAVAHVKSAKDARNRFATPRLVVLDAGQGTYRAILAVHTENEVIGPPGGKKKAKCDRWAKQKKWIYGVLRTANGCPR
jgi:hypothetical protein